VRVATASSASNVFTAFVSSLLLHLICPNLRSALPVEEWDDGARQQIGVSFMCSAIAAPTAAGCETTSGKKPACA
jgi:hypothetical protein